LIAAVTSGWRFLVMREFLILEVDAGGDIQQVASEKAEVSAIDGRTQANGKQCPTFGRKGRKVHTSRGKMKPGPVRIAWTCRVDVDAIGRIRRIHPTSLKSHSLSSPARFPGFAT